MSDKKIQVELTEAEARNLVAFLRDTNTPALGAEVSEVEGKIRAALPPEYPEGTVAWVTADGERYLCAFRSGQWLMADRVELMGKGDRKVEPLRVLADDEIAVKRRGWTASEANIRYLRESAHALPNSSAQVLDDFADALDAEATS